MLSAVKESRVLTLYFGVNQFEVYKSDLQEAIDSAGLTLEALRKSATLVAITGYTDCAGTAEYNRDLSIKRARAVALMWEEMTGVRATTVKGEGKLGCHPKESAYVDLKRKVEIKFEIEIAEKQPNLEGDFTSASSANVGAILPITGLNFIGGKHYPLAKSYEVLDELVKIMKENPTLVIEIQGHVCCGNVPGEDGVDLDTGEPKLSENRAKFVYEHLVKNGIAPERMAYKGFAQTRPLPVTLEDPGLESLNRRVEIMIVSK